MLIRANAGALPLRDGVVQTCVTSPPYWGLRDYGTATWVGGDAACDHAEKRGTTRGGPYSTITGGLDTTAHAAQYRDTCGKCGAQRVDQQLGLEPTPDAYVAQMVAVFREVKRVLRNDGVCWLNLGDSYASSKVGNTNFGQSSTLMSDGRPEQSRLATLAKEEQNMRAMQFRKELPPDMKPKDLVGIPWKVAFALQADGWYLRADVIWSKPNPMPESVTDRPTKSHEYVFILTKSARYYWDADAVREPHVRIWNESNGGTLARGNPRLTQAGRNDGGRLALPIPNPNGRNIRSVWSIATQPYPGSHFATMPEALAERCVLAATKPGDLVLDPFVGSGTVGRVAISTGRRFVGCDLNAAYLQLARERLAVTRGLPLAFDGCDGNGHEDGAQLAFDLRAEA